jgi:hypothetical protein
MWTDPKPLQKSPNRLMLSDCSPSTMQIKIYFPLEIEEHIVKEIGTSCQALRCSGITIYLFINE